MDEEDGKRNGREKQLVGERERKGYVEKNVRIVNHGPLKLQDLLLTRSYNRRRKGLPGRCVSQWISGKLHLTHNIESSDYLYNIDHSETSCPLFSMVSNNCLIRSRLALVSCIVTLFVVRLIQ